MELAAGARHRPAVLLLSAGCLPGRDRRRASGGIGWARRATAAGPRLTLLRPHVSRRVAASAASGGRFLPRHIARSGGGEPRGEDDACTDRSFPTRADPLDDAKDHAAAARLATDHPRGIRKELVNLAMPAIIGQAIDALAQLLETAYIGRLGPVQLASAAVGVSVFNIVSKLFNIPLLSITTSFVAEDVSTHDSSQFTSDTQEEIYLARLEKGRGLPPYLLLYSWQLQLVSWNTPQHYGCLTCINYARCCKAISFYKGTRCSCCCNFFGYSRCLSWVRRYKDTSTLQWYFSMFLLLWSLSKKAVLLPLKVEDLDFVGYIKSSELQVDIKLLLANSDASELWFRIR